MQIKRFILGIMAMGVAAILCQAQEAKIRYTEQIKVPANVKELPDNIRLAVEAQLKQRINTMCLYYKQGESVYMADNSANANSSQTNASASQTNIQVQSSADKAVTYKNQKSRELISQESILDRMFLITEKLESIQWKIESTEKKIGHFSCKKAVSKDDVVAWFCTEIPINDGPGSYYGLPGLILELETANKIITAEEIDLKCKEAGNIKKPTSGKKVSREEFNKTKKKKLEEMGVQDEGSGVSIIKM